MNAPVGGVYLRKGNPAQKHADQNFQTAQSTPEDQACSSDVSFCLGQSHDPEGSCVDHPLFQSATK